MYLPTTFASHDRDEILAHMAAHPFATVSSCLGEALLVGHLPLLVDAERNVLRGHLAKENAQFQHFAGGAEVVAAFHGPHGYVSPSVYGTPGVPTWNYAVVHARGKARVLSRSELMQVLHDSVARFETSGWRMAPEGAAIRSKLEAIAGFEIDIRTLEGKWKLSQNRPTEDRARVIDWLAQGDDASRATAVLMRERELGFSSPRDP
jgi:transcriptional regulator